MTALCNLKTIALIAFLLCFLVSSFADEHKSPSEVINLWTEVYGVEQGEAAELTTENLRNGKSKKEWIEYSYNALKQIGYKHLVGFIIGEEINGDKATVIMNSQVVTIVGSSWRKETYYLKQIDGKWLIDEIKVSDEWSPDSNSI